MNKRLIDAELDQEWVELLLAAKEIGMNQTEIRDFLAKQRVLHNCETIK